MPDGLKDAEPVLRAEDGSGGSVLRIGSVLPGTNEYDRCHEPMPPPSVLPQAQSESRMLQPTAIVVTVFLIFCFLLP
ncbi:hypothetical protein RGR602_PC00600 (plasmid) [Rhizobium gallicum bv. gallicum R602sp]|uniref:Uncharacterized protein n=1 Tax=Rhizobium gallicum bv. gallicum R602sp TaxID=1041138 RepID=A0A0B4X9G0_9HYPH|nr:hypothetical protein RGR602_PC00600 [Rhizobium gallicum bv. gallicum R602sp]